MDRTVLAGYWILVVEDEVLIALDIADSLRAAGASVLTARTLCDGLRLAEEPRLSAAVLDLALSDGNGAPLCDRLNQRDVPFVLYTGFHCDVHGACDRGIRVEKPASPQTLVDTLAHMLLRVPGLLVKASMESCCLGEGSAMKARQLIGAASYGPDALKVLFKAFDDAWEVIAPTITARAGAIEATRPKLADVILSLARDGASDPDKIKNAALHIMGSDAES